MIRSSALLTAGAATLVFAGAAAAAPADTDASSGFSLHGLFFVDAAWLDGETAQGRDGQESDLRLGELRLQRKAGDFHFTLDYDFAGEGEWRDVGVSLGLGDWSVGLGHFKEPASLDKLTPQGGTVFVEPARFTKAFGLGRRLGIHARYEGRNVVFMTAATRGSLADEPKRGFGSEQTAISGRVAYTPVREYDRTFHLGAYARWLDYGDIGVKTGAPTLSVLGAKTVVADFTKYGPAGRADSSTLYGLEAAYASGPVFASGEVAAMTFDRPAGEETATAAYAQASIAVTGETRPYKGGKGAFGAIKPARPLGQGGYGALEVAARIDHVDLGGFVTGSSTTVTGGLTWTPRQDLRIMGNVAEERGDGALGDSTSWTVRIQVSF